MCKECIGVLDELSDVAMERANSLHDLVSKELGRVHASREDGDADLSSVVNLTLLRVLAEIQQNQGAMFTAHANLMARLVSASYRKETE